MKNQNTFSVSFFAKYGKENSNGETSIYYRITIGKERTEIATQFYIQREQWEFLQENPATRKNEYEKVKEMMDIFRAKIREKYYELLNNSETISANTLKLKVLGKLESRRRIIDVADYFYRLKKAMVGKTIESTTAEKFLTGN